MSDEDQGAIPPENEQPTPESEAAPVEDAADEPAPDVEPASEPTGSNEAEAPGGGDDAPEVSPDAAAALAAAQAAVADALGGDLSGGDADAVDAAQETAEATGEELEAMMAAAIEAEKNGSGDSSGAAPFAMPEFSPAGLPADSAEMQLLGDVNVDVRIELGRTRMLVEDVLRLGAGAVVELEKLAGDPVDVYVNGRHVAKGEVLVLNESFCVRVNEVLEPVSGEKQGE